MPRAGSKLLVAVGLWSCGSDCPRSTGYSEVRGTPADFVTAPGPRDGYEIVAPTECTSEAGQTARVVEVKGTGWRTLARGGCTTAPDSDEDCATLDPAFVQARFVNQLRGQQISAQPPWECAGGRYGVLIDDWAAADAAVSIVATAAAEWELSGSVVVVVGPFLYQASPSEC
jgi:hypothetical protein